MSTKVTTLLFKSLGIFVHKVTTGSITNEISVCEAHGTVNYALSTLQKNNAMECNKLNKEEIKKKNIKNDHKQHHIQDNQQQAYLSEILVRPELSLRQLPCIRVSLTLYY